jgi:hypothetical protein
MKLKNFLLLGNNMIIPRDSWINEPKVEQTAESNLVRGLLLHRKWASMAPSASSSSQMLSEGQRGSVFVSPTMDLSKRYLFNADQYHLV